MRGPNTIRAVPYDIVGQQLPLIHTVNRDVKPKKKQDIDIVTAHVSKTLGPIQILRRLHGGVSGSEVHEAVVKVPDGEDKLVVLKHDADVGEAERRGSSLLRPHINVSEVLAWGKDHAVLEKVDGQTLHDRVINPTLESDSQLRIFTQLHMNLWEQTEASDIHEMEGYAKKGAATIQQALISPLNFTSKDRVVDVIDKPLIVNGIQIGTMRDALNTMIAQVTAQNVGVLSHGDEGLRNCIVKPNNELVMVDNGSAGLRSVYEPIAKTLLWFEASTSSPSNPNPDFYINSSDVHLHAQTELPPHVAESVRLMRAQLEPYLSTPEQKATAAAFMMMYLFRELQWLEKRGREKMAPYVVAKAFSLAPALKNEGYQPFPLAMQEQLPPFTSYPSRRGSTQPAIA